MKVIVYSFLVMDLPHWGHILHLKKAKELGDFLVVGILDNDTVASYKRIPIMSFEERMKVASEIKGVDMVIPQFQQYPLNNLKLLHTVFPDEKLICVHGSDWKKSEFGNIITFFKSIGGELKLLPYYSGTNTTNILEEVVKKFRETETL